MTLAPAVQDAIARCERATLVYDLAAIEGNLARVAAAARAAQITPLFALKSFPHPRIRELAARHVAGFDVASLGELHDLASLAERYAAPDARILSIVDPSGAAVAHAPAHARVIVGCETVDHIRAAPPHAELAIRISASITDRDPAVGALLEGTGRRRSRFGIDTREELATLLRAAVERDDGAARRVGIHVHHGPVTATSAERFVATARAALALFAEARELAGIDRRGRAAGEPAFIDLGGAWHGIADIGAAFAEIRAAFPTIGTVPPDLEIFVEPGRLYAENSGFATGRVLSTRELPDRILSVVELSRVCHLRWSQVELVARPPHPGAGRKLQLVGPTCYEEDVLGEWIVEPTELRDRVVLANVSGYALAWNTSFGGVPAADIVFVP